MKKKEALEIAKKEIVEMGWNDRLELAFAFKTEKQTLFYSESIWEIEFYSENLYTDTIWGQVLSRYEIAIFIDDTLGKVINSKVKAKKYLVKMLASYFLCIQISDPLEIVLEYLLSIVLFPFKILYEIMIGFPVTLIKEWSAPPEIKIYCPRCGGELRTINAKQCCHCFFAWHNVNE